MIECAKNIDEHISMVVASASHYALKYGKINFDIKTINGTEKVIVYGKSWATNSVGIPQRIINADNLSKYDNIDKFMDYSNTYWKDWNQTNMKMTRDEMKLFVNMLSKESELIIAKLSWVLDFIFTILVGNLVVLGIDNVSFFYLVAFATTFDVLLIVFTIWLIVLQKKNSSIPSHAILFNGLILTKIGIMLVFVSSLLCIESKYTIESLSLLISVTIISVVMAIFLFIRRIQNVKIGKVKKDSTFKWLSILIPVVILARYSTIIDFSDDISKDIKLAFWLFLVGVFLGLLLGIIELRRYYFLKRYNIILDG